MQGALYFVCAKESKQENTPSCIVIISARHEALYPSTTAVPNDYNILHLEYNLV